MVSGAGEPSSQEAKGWRLYRTDVPEEDDDPTLAAYCPTCAITELSQRTFGIFWFRRRRQLEKGAKMPLLGRKTEEEKAAKEAARAKADADRSAEQARRQAEEQERQVQIMEHVRGLPKWEYQVKRIGEDKQKGLLGSQRMEQIFNGEGAQGWELVAIHEERATFKRMRFPENT